VQVANARPGLRKSIQKVLEYVEGRDVVWSTLNHGSSWTLWRQWVKRTDRRRLQQVEQRLSTRQQNGIVWTFMGWSCVECRRPNPESQYARIHGVRLCGRQAERSLLVRHTFMEMTMRVQSKKSLAIATLVAFKYIAVRSRSPLNRNSAQLQLTCRNLCKYIVLVICHCL
jgi:hypothetical protein